MRHRDDAEFARFAEAARDRLRRTAYLMTGDWHRAADIAQEAMVRVYVAWPRLESRGGAMAYARRAVVSVAIDLGRRASSREQPRPAEQLPDRPVDDSSTLDDRQMLVEALRDLPPRQRACLVLRYFEDLSVTEVAAVLGCSEGTVKSQTSRALTTLRQRVDLDERTIERSRR